MRPFALLSVLLLALLPAAQAFNFTFTSPDPSQKLNVSQPVEIKWDGTLSDKNPDLFDWIVLRFTVIRGSQGTGSFSWQIAGDVLTTDRSYTWQPNMTDWEMDVLDDKVHFFEAILKNDWVDHLASAESERYAIEGYARLVSEGARRGADNAVLAGVLAGVAVVGTLILG